MKEGRIRYSKYSVCCLGMLFLGDGESELNIPEDRFLVSEMRSATRKITYALRLPAPRPVIYTLSAPAIKHPSPLKKKRKYDPKAECTRAPRIRKQRVGESGKSTDQPTTDPAIVSAELEDTLLTADGDAWSGGYEPLMGDLNGRPTREECTSYEKFEELVLASCCDFFQISSKWCVIQGFNSRRGVVTVRPRRVSGAITDD